jgi:transposase
MRCVPVQSVVPHELQALHRVWERLRKARTAWGKETGGLLHADGMIVPQGATTLRTHVLEKLASAASTLIPLSRALCQQWLEALAALDARVATYAVQRAQVAQTQPVWQRLMRIPSRGALTATARVAAVSDVAQLNHECQGAVWLGGVPQHHSTGGRAPLGHQQPWRPRSVQPVGAQGRELAALGGPAARPSESIGAVADRPPGVKG